MPFRSRHLDPDELGAAVWEAPTGRSAAHLASCEACRRELDAIVAALSADRASAHREADEAFAPMDLARQRQSIQQRIARLGIAARVLPFRGSRATPDPGGASAPSDRRWIVAAAAAGLVLGVAVGRGPWTAPTVTADADTGLDATRVALVETVGGDAFRDDPLLVGVEEVLALDTRPEFEALDALTPLPDEGR
jgi:hypothetical protein